MLKYLPSVAVLLSVLLCLGCANRYSDTFTSAGLRDYAPVEQTQIVRVGSDDPMAIYKRDFPSAELIGTSCWIGNEAAGDDCRGFARKIGADLVLWGCRPYSEGTHTYNMVVPSQETTYHSGRGTYLGHNGSGTFNYSGSSTTYGLTNVPMTSHFVWHEFKTVYLRKREASAATDGGKF